VPHDVVELKTGSTMKLVMQLDRDVQVCGIFLFVFLSTPCFEIFLLLLFLRGVILHFYICSLVGAYIYIHTLFILFEHTPFFNDPSLLLQEYKKRKLI
jgi:hypothetical protein